MAKIVNNKYSRELAFNGHYGERRLQGTDTSPANEYYIGFYVVADSVLTWKNDTPYGDSTQTSITLKAGSTMVGYMYDIEMTSGDILAKIG